LLIWLNENVGLHPTFSTLGIPNEFALLSLNENVGFYPTFSTLGIPNEFALLSLNENVHFRPLCLIKVDWRSFIPARG
jgi:hypothetical protein